MALFRLPCLLVCLLSRLILRSPAPRRGLASPCLSPRTAIDCPVPGPTSPAIRSAPIRAAGAPAPHPRLPAPKTHEFDQKIRPKLSLASPPPMGAGWRETVPPLSPTPWSRRQGRVARRPAALPDGEAAIHDQVVAGDVGGGVGGQEDRRALQFLHLGHAAQRRVALPDRLGLAGARERRPFPYGCSPDSASSRAPRAMPTRRPSTC